MKIYAKQNVKYLKKQINLIKKIILKDNMDVFLIQKRGLDRIINSDGEIIEIVPNDTCTFIFEINGGAKYNIIGKKYARTKKKKMKNIMNGKIDQLKNGQKKEKRF